MSMDEFPHYVRDYFEKHGRQFGGQIGEGSFSVLADHAKQCVYVLATMKGESKRFDGDTAMADAQNWLKGFGATLQ